MGLEDTTGSKAPIDKQTTSRKALRILGVDPSAKKVMNKLGVDERTLKKG